MTGERILIAGYGQLGRQLSRVLTNAGHTVYGLRRSASKLDPGVIGLRADLLQPAQLTANLPSSLDRVYYILTPSQRDEAGYRDAYIHGLSHLMAALERQPSQAPRLIFVSSTAVYGQNAGDWVDEHSPTQPTGFNGQCLLEAEHRLTQYPGRSIRLRFAGIYGPGREALIRRVKAGKPCQNQPIRYTNRIHSDDCVGILAHVGGLSNPDPLYIGVDDYPCPQCEVMDWLAKALKAERPPRQGGGNAGRRCDNARLKASGYTLRYPSFVSGYQSLLAEPRRNP